MGSSTDLTSRDGSISITGTGNGNGYGNHGVSLHSMGTISSTGTGNEAATISITGTGGGAKSYNYGVHLRQTRVLSADGAISITGTGGIGSEAGNNGVDIEAGASVQVTTGLLTVTGTAEASHSFGVRLHEVTGGQLLSAGSGGIVVTADGRDFADFRAGARGRIGFDGKHVTSGDITIIADSIEWDRDLNIESTGHLKICPRTPSTSIGMGGGVGALNLDDMELRFLKNGFSAITIGDPANGTGPVLVDSSAFRDDVTIYGGAINVTNSLTNQVDESITLNGNITNLTATSSIQFGTAGALGSPGILDTRHVNLLGGQFAVKVLGTSPGTEYSRMNVTGNVTINGASLAASLADKYVPTIGDSIVIISNDKTDAVSGTFKELPEGAMLKLDDTTFVITYAGGPDKNDVVLTVSN